jgi:hypothetical protein
MVPVEPETGERPQLDQLSQFTAEKSGCSIKPFKDFIAAF